MASGDYKSSRSSGGGWGRGGGGSSYRGYEPSEETEARGRSKMWYDRCKDAQPRTYAFLDTNPSLLQAYQAMTRITRYGKYDWDRVKEEMLNGNEARMLEAKIAKLLEEERQREEEKRRARDAESKAYWDRRAIEREEEERERAKIKQTKTQEILNFAEDTAGMIRSDFSQIFKRRENYDMFGGDFIDEPVMALTTGYGYAEEVQRPVGIKLQITLSFDFSNSIWRNKIAKPAVGAFRSMWIALKRLQETYPTDIYIAPFVFAKNRDGRGVERLTDTSYDWETRTNKPSGNPLGEVREFLNIDDYQPSNAGEDTRFEPLLLAIEKWEQENSDPGAVCIDLVITDGIFQYKADYEACNVVQARRNGNKQTIFLNFLPESETKGIAVPRRTTMYNVNSNSIDGTLRNILAHFASVNYL